MKIGNRDPDSEESEVTDAAQPVPARRRLVLVRVSLIVLGLGLLAFALTLVSEYPPTDESFYPKCTLHRTTGLHCPGCGLTRSVFSLIHGRVAQAFAYNPFMALFSPFLLVMAVRAVWFWVWGVKDARSLMPRRAGWPIMIALAVFWILRNVPYFPFNLLAPHELNQ